MGSLRKESFRETVRLYRLSRLLFDLPALPKVDGDIAQSYGFGSRSLLEAAFYGMFDLPGCGARPVLASTEARKRMAAPNVNGSVDAPFNPVACEGYSWAVPRCFGGVRRPQVRWMPGRRA